MSGQSGKRGASAIDSTIASNIASGVFPDVTPDVIIDAALRRLNAVEPPVRLKQRMHAHLEQATEAMEAAAAAKAARRLRAAKFRPWKIAAVSALSAACVTLTVTLALPLRRLAPVSGPPGSGRLAAGQNVSQNAANPSTANFPVANGEQTMVAGLSGAYQGQNLIGQSSAAQSSAAQHSPVAAYNASRIMSPAMRKARARRQHELDVANRNRKLISFLRSLSPAQMETLRAATPEAATVSAAPGSSATSASQKSGSALPPPQSK